MFRRLPIFLVSSFAATVGLFILTSVLTAQPPALPPATKPDTGPIVPIDPAALKKNQEENKKKFALFEAAVLRLAQRWEKSDNADEKERAKTLREVLKMIEDKGVDKYFNELIESLSQSNPTTGDLGKALDKDDKLRAALRDILDLLNTENELATLRKEIEKAMKDKEALTKLISKVENLRARTLNPNSDANKLEQAQKDATQNTRDVANSIENKGGKDNKGGNGGEKPEPKSEPKAEAKPDDNAGEPKADTNENKSESKGDGKDGMGSPMSGDPKAGDSKGGDPKAGGDPKKNDKPTDSKAGGDPKKGSDPKTGGDPKASPPKNSDGMKPSDGKPQGGDSKSQGQGKGEGKPSAGQQGGEGKPSSGGMGGMPMQGGQQSAGSSKGGQGGQSGQQQPKKDPIAQQVEQAVPPQQGAEDDLKKNDKQAAAGGQDKAIDELKKALDELEKRLKQLREKELAKLLSNLEERVNRMIRMQTEVLGGTVQIDGTVRALGGTPGSAEIQKSQAEADKEGAIVTEADKALQLLTGEGTAVVFAGVLQQVKGDMEAIQKRLNETRVAKDTQNIEQDVIDQLKLMLEALKKAKQDLENKPGQSQPGDPNAKKQDQKLIDLLNELKLIKSLQEQLNKRTVSYNSQDPGEQAKDARVQEELKQLSERQKVLQDMLHKIATQANQ